MAILQSRFSHSDVKILDKTTRYSGYFKIEQYRLQHRLFKGGWMPEFERELFERGDSIAVLPYDPDRDEVVLIEQFRAGAIMSKTSPWLFEIVAGALTHTDATPEALAKQEAQEEAGLNLHHLQLINKFWVSPGGATEQISLFWSRVDASQVYGIHGLVKEHEDIKVHVVPSQKAFAALAAGEINNAITIIALQWLQLNHDKLVK